MEVTNSSEKCIKVTTAKKSNKDRAGSIECESGHTSTRSIDINNMQCLNQQPACELAFTAGVVESHTQIAIKQLETETTLSDYSSCSSLKTLFEHMKSMKVELMEKNFLLSSIIVNSSEIVENASENSQYNIRFQSHPVTSSQDVPEKDIIDDLIHMNSNKHLQDGNDFSNNCQESVSNVNTIVSDIRKWPEETVLLVGDSILNYIDPEKLSRKYTIRRIAFPGISVEEVASQLTLLLIKKPKYVLLHVDTHSPNYSRTLKDVLTDLLKIRNHIEKCLPTALVIICCPSVSNNDVILDSNKKEIVMKQELRENASSSSTDQIQLEGCVNDQSDVFHANSLEQITLTIQDNANLRLALAESKKEIVCFMEENNFEKNELLKETAEKGDKINELLEVINSLKSQPAVDLYGPGVENVLDDLDDVHSCGSDDEGKQQMKHVIKNYETRINELQKLYDHDVFSLENENEKLRKEVKELQSNYLNVSHSNSSFAIDFEDLKASYDDKINNLKSHYEDLLQKECVNAKKQQNELLSENNKLQTIVEEAEKKFLQHLQNMEANINSNYHTDLTSEVQKILTCHTTSVSAIKEDLQRELNDIKSTHHEDLCSVEQEFSANRMNKSGLDDAYSNEILKLTEERNLAQKATQLLKDELLFSQQEYESLKNLYDALAFDVDQYKEEKVNLLAQISDLSEESKNLKSTLRSRRNEVDDYKTKITDASKTIENYTKKIIEKSERSSNASDSLRSELEDFAMNISSPRAFLNISQEMKNKSNMLSTQVKLLRSNLDEANIELKQLYQEQGLSTTVYDRLTNILNLLKKYIESDVFDQEADFPDKDEDKKCLDDQSKNKAFCDDTQPLNTCDISENLSLDDDDLSDTTATSENLFTHKDFENELQDLKIDIPLNYCSNSISKDETDGKDVKRMNQENEVTVLRRENEVLKKKVHSLSSDNIFDKMGLTSDFIHENTSLSLNKFDSLKELLDNVSIFEGNDLAGYKKRGLKEFSSVLEGFKSTLDALKRKEKKSSGLDASTPKGVKKSTCHEIVDYDFDWENSVAEWKGDTFKPMDSEGHTLKERDSLCKSISDLEIENKNLKKENLSLREEVERDCTAIIGPGFASEILYYEHAQPLNDDSVGIKVNAIKSLLNNVVINQGNEAVSFHEYNGCDVILRLLLDIQVEVVDLIKENNVLKEETVKQVPVSSCSVQTGDSLLEVVDEIDFVAEADKELSLKNFLILDDSDSLSLAEQDIDGDANSNAIKKKVEAANNVASSMCTIFLDDQSFIGQESVEEEIANLEMESELSNTVKKALKCEIVNLGGDSAYIKLKVDQKEKKVLLPSYSAVSFTVGQVQDIVANVSMCDDNLLQQTSEAFVQDVLKETVRKIKDEPRGSSSPVAEKVAPAEDSIGETVDEENSLTIVPGLSYDTLCQRQLNVTQNMDIVHGVDSLGLLVENLLIFEGNEENGYRSSNGNQLTQRFLKDCQDQLSQLKDENAALGSKSLQPDTDLGNQTNVMDTSIQRGLLGQILTYTQHAATACSKENEKKDEEFKELKKDMNELDLEKSLIIPGISNLALTGYVSDDLDINDMPLLLERFSLFEGNDADGFTKSEEKDENAKKVLYIFKTKISSLINENDILRRKVDKMQAICESRVHDEVISIEKIPQTFNMNVELGGEDIFPGFNSKLLLSEDTTPEVDSLRCKINAIRKIFENLSIFKGNESSGYTRADDMNVSLQLLDEFENEVNEIRKQKAHPYPNGQSQTCAPRSLSEVQDESSKPLENQYQETLEKCHYLDATNAELIDLLVKKDNALEKLITQQSQGDNKEEHDYLVGVEYEQSLRFSRSWMEAVNLESLAQLREDLDDDYIERIKVVEEKLRESYTSKIKRVTEKCDLKVKQMKNDYVDEIRKLQESPDFLEEAELSLSSIKESSNQNMKNDTNDDLEEQIDFDEIDVFEEPIKREEEDEIIKLKEFLSNVFCKKVNNESVVFKSRDVDNLLDEDFISVSDITDKLRDKLCLSEKEVHEKGEDENSELIVNTKINVLNDVAILFKDLVTEHTLFVDGKLVEVLTEHGENISALVQGIEFFAGKKSGSQNSNISAKIEQNINEILNSEDNVSCFLKCSDHIVNAFNGIFASKLEMDNSNEYLKQSILEPESSVWKQFLKDDIFDDLALNKKKYEFKLTVEQDLNSLVKCLNFAFTKVFQQVSQYLDMRYQLKEQKSQENTIKSLAVATTDMVLKNSVQTMSDPHSVLETDEKEKNEPNNKNADKCKKLKDSLKELKQQMSRNTKNDKEQTVSPEMNLVQQQQIIVDEYITEQEKKVQRIENEHKEDIEKIREKFMEQITELKKAQETPVHTTPDIEVNQVKQSYTFDSEARLQRLQRQDEESANFINMLQSDIKKITEDRNFLEDEIQLLRQNSKDIVCLIIKSEELLHEKLDEIIDNQLSGCNLSQYGLDATSGSFPGKDGDETTMIEMPLDIDAERDFEPEFLKGVSSRFSDTIDHFLQVLSLVFSDFKNTSMQHSQSMESCDASNGEENEFPVDLKDALQTPEILFSHLEDKVNKNLDVTKEVSALKESSRMKDNIIFNLEKTCADHKNLLLENENNKKVFETEIEALKCAVKNQLCDIEGCKEQMIKKQMLMDAKECQLIELEEQLKKNNQNHMKEIADALDDQSTLKHSLEERSKELNDHKDFIESKQTLISELEKQLSDHQILIESKENQSLILKKELTKQKEKYELDYEKLLSKKNQELSAASYKLEEVLEQNKSLETCIKDHESSTLRLSEEFDKLNSLTSTKEEKMVENESRLKQDILRLSLELEDSSSNHSTKMYSLETALVKSTRDKNIFEEKFSQAEEQLKEHKMLLINKEEELKKAQEDLANHKEKHAMDLKELSDDKGKEISAIFNELEEKLKEKDALEDTVKKQVKSIQLLQDQLDTHNILNNTKDAKMNEREELLKKEIKKLQADLDKLNASKNEELTNTQIALDEISKQKDEVEDLVNLKQAYIMKLEEHVRDSNSTLEKHAEEKEQGLKEIQNGKAEKTEKILTLQSSIDQISVEKVQMLDVLNKQQVYIRELEEQMKKLKDFIDEKQEQLNDLESELDKTKESHEADLDKLIESFGDQNIQSKEMDEIIETYKLSVTKLDQEVKQYKELLDEKDIELTEVEKQKMGYLTELENANVEEKDRCINDLRSTLDEQKKEKEELEALFKSQKNVLSQMEEELNKYKAAVDLKDEQMTKQADQLSEEKEKEVGELLNESIELKNVMASLEENLESKLNDEAALSEILEKEKTYSGELEREANAKGEEILTLKLKMESEATQHLADLEEISVVKDEMIDTIQKALEEQCKEKDTFEREIDKQHAIIAGLEEKLRAHKKFNDEKILMLEEKEQVIKSKDNNILDLTKKIEENDNKSCGMKNSLQKAIAEHEMKTHNVEEALKHKSIQVNELNKDINSLKEHNRGLEMKIAEVLSSEHQKSSSIEKINLVKNEEVSTLQKICDDKTKENNGLTQLVESLNDQVSIYQAEVDEMKQLLAAKCSELAGLKQHHAKLLGNLKESEDNSVDIKQLLDDKSKQDAERSLKIEKQKNHISELEKQVHELQEALNGRNDEISLYKKQLLEKNKHEAEYNETLMKQNDTVTSLQLESEKHVVDKEELMACVKEQQSHLCELEEQLNHYKDYHEAQESFLHECEKSKAEKEKLLLESREREAVLKEKITNFESMFKDKSKEERGVNELLQKQQYEIQELEKKILVQQSSVGDKNSELSALKQQLAQERNRYMTDFEKASSKQKETILNMEKVLEEEIKEKEALKGYMQSQDNLADELEKQLNGLKLELQTKDDTIVKMGESDKNAINSLNNFEATIADKSECIQNLEKQIDEHLKNNNDLSEIIQKKESQIKELEEETLEVKNTLYKLKDTHEADMKNRLSIADDLESQVAAKDGQIAKLENELKEISGKVKEFEDIGSEFDTASKEKEHQISVLEKNFRSQIKETDELKDIVKRQQALVCELEDELNQERTKLANKEKELKSQNGNADENQKLHASENNIQEPTSERNDLKNEVMKQRMKISELQQEVQELNTLLQGKDYELDKVKGLAEVNYDEVKRWEKEKESLTQLTGQLEESIRNLDYETNKKGGELSQLQKAHQEMQLTHINEIMKLNNDHRTQISTLMDIPQKDRNIKVLLMDLQKEADEVLDLVLNVPDVNENTPVERVETLKANWLQEKEMLLSIIDDMRKNVSKENETGHANNNGGEDLAQEEVGGASTVSTVSEIKHDGYDEDSSGVHSSRIIRSTQSGHQHIFHDKGIVSEFEKLLSKESKKVEDLTARLDEEVSLKESIQMAHEVELAKVVERELNLKEKYLKVAELLQKEKNAKTRVMEMLNDAQRLNEIQSQNLEDVQNDKNSLLESYTIVSQLENLLAKEKERVDLITAKLDQERHEKSSLQIELEDEKEKVIAMEEQENSLKGKCIELNKLLLKENEDKKNIIDTLDNEKKLMSMERINLEQKESTLNQLLAKLGDGNLEQKLRTLKLWEEELKKRERALVIKEEKLEALMKRIEHGYDIVPQKQTKDLITPENMNRNDVLPDNYDQLKQVDYNQLLDTKHLPLVADLNQKIKNLQKEKVKLADTLTDLKTEIVEYKLQLKEYQGTDKENGSREKPNRLSSISTPVQLSETNVENGLTADGQKLINAGWTIAKVQRLYLKYFRAESFRKALVYQKRYLNLMINEGDVVPTGVIGVNNWTSHSQHKPSFKVVVLAIISIRRMKYLVRKYHRNLHKSSPEYQYKDKTRNNIKKKNPENVIDELENYPPPPVSVGNLEDERSNGHFVPSIESNLPHFTSTPAKVNSRTAPFSAPRYSYYPPTNRLTLSEPAKNTRRDTDVNDAHKKKHESYINTNSISRPNISLANLYTNDDVPRSYPRPTGIHPEIIPSRNSENPTLDKSSYTGHRVPQAQVNSSNYGGQHNSNCDESLSSYIHTLEHLQNKLKKVGYNDRTKPSLM